MVAWFTVVVEANCTRQPVSFLFPHSGIRRRGGNNKETTSLVVLASDTNISYATTATTLSVYSPNCHDIARISLRNEVVCNSVHCRFNNLINNQQQAAETINTFWKIYFYKYCLPTTMSSIMHQRYTLRITLFMP